MGVRPVDTSKVAMAALAMLATLIVGLAPDRAAPAFFLLGLAGSLFLLRRAFPAMWLYSFWLVALYVFAFIGATLFTFSAAVSGPSLGPVPVLLAGFVVCELIGLYIGLSLFAEVKSIRDFRTRLSIARGDSPPEYTRIGLWTLALLAFFAGANLSAVVFVGWVRGAGVLLPVHAGLEGLLIGLWIYLLLLPESAFGKVPPEFREGVPPPLDFESKPGDLGRRPGCPVCHLPLEWEMRACPSCARPREVGWCPASEVHVVDCEHCARPVIYGKVVCPHCKGELLESLRCHHCQARAALRDWKPAPSP
jgi:hypothetical protein